MGEKDKKPGSTEMSLREDIAQELAAWRTEGSTLIPEFFAKYPNERFDIQDFMKRATIEGSRLINGEKTQNLISSEEIQSYFRMKRYVDERLSIASIPIPDEMEINQIDANGVSVEWQNHSETDDDKVILYFKGGGFTAGSVKTHRCLTFPIARLCKTRMLSIDYRLAPEHTFPAQIRDAYNSYTYLLDEGFSPSDIVLMGLSAGGTLALSLLAKLKQDRVNLPAGVVLKSPFIDLLITPSVFKSWSQYPAESEAGIFLTFAGVMACFGMADLENPLVSPIHANMMGFPPMLIQIGTKDIAYDQGRELANEAEQAGVNVILEQYPDMIHGFQYMDLPERAEAFKNIAMFVHETLD